MKSAAAPAQDFLDRASEVDVDHVEARFHQLGRPGGELFRLGPHQLPADRPFLVGHVQEMTRAASVLTHLHQKLVQHHFAQCIRGAVAPRQHPHRPVAVARQGGLHNRKPHRKASDRQRFPLGFAPHCIRLVCARFV